MRLSVEWIKEFAPVEADAEEIGRRLTMAGLELEEIGTSPIGPVLDIKVTPNRGDCLSAIGVARELAAVSDVHLRRHAPPSSAGQALPGVTVTIEDAALCPRYAARLVRNIRFAPSPDWMQARLEAAGMRPINGVVDVTNYVMLEMGQPLHAFDFGCLTDGAIVVRPARHGEMLRTLDGVDHALAAGMLVIADAEKPVAVAGVMGGADSEMTEATGTMLLESAHFSPRAVRRTARLLGMRTEASYRFERTVDPAGVTAAADRACELIARLGLGEVVPGVVDVYPGRANTRVVGVRPARVALLLGYSVTEDDVSGALTRLGFVCAPAGDEVLATVPTWRPDVTREEDLAEEVGRVLGYERIPERLPHGDTVQGAISADRRFASRLRRALSAAGLQEVVCHSLVAPGPFEDDGLDGGRIAIRSALSAELSGLRRSLLPGLVDALERNARRGQAPLAFYEVGVVFSQGADGCEERLHVGAVLAGPVGATTWHRDARTLPADFYLASGLVERVFDAAGLSAPTLSPSGAPRLHPGRAAVVTAGGSPVGWVGELHPDLAAGLTVRSRVVAFELDVPALQGMAAQARPFAMPAPHPGVTRDLAPRVALDVPFARVAEAVAAAAPLHLESWALTDVFTGSPLPEGVQALTLSFAFRADDHTLTEVEVTEALAGVRAELEARCGATFPGA